MPGRRISFATIAVSGLGAFVALAVGATLYVSASRGLRSTHAWIAQQAEARLDALEQRLEARLRPVADQGESIAEAFADGRIDPARPAVLDAFMFGALGATPQVSDLGIVDPFGRTRRWSRGALAASSADWSQRPEVRKWLVAGREQDGPAWRPLVWEDAAVRGPSLLHQVALQRAGNFVGMLGQVVPMAKLSEDLAVFGAEYGVTPFVLYGPRADLVVAHRAFAGAGTASGGLPAIVDAGDPVLARLHSPDGPALLSGALKRAKGVRASVSETTYVFLTREVQLHGREPWTIGLYFDPVQGGQRAEMMRTLYSIGVGLAVLALAVALAAIAGRRLGRPIEALARAAHLVRKGRLGEVQTLPRSRIYELDEANRSFAEMVEGLRERNVMRETLGQFLPEQVALELLAGGGRIEPEEAKATVLIGDIEGFATLTDTLGAHRTIEFLNAYFEVMVGIIERYRGVVTQFQGDAVLAVFNVPIADRDHGANALRAALEIVRAAQAQSFAGVRALNRVGISTGRVVAGAVGAAGRLTYTVHGNAVNLAARLEALNKEYGTRILLSDKTAERCPGFRLRKVADAQIRGYGAPVALYTPEER
ncbi:MAG TPA: adenylate/guanylate cyclase domain-containing protein [Burkholderiales bacterium]|nr:adenylate/guanylate cyclase domain-containing protein [Burkholderiales bacterium]